MKIGDIFTEYELIELIVSDNLEDDIRSMLLTKYTFNDVNTFDDLVSQIADQIKKSEKIVETHEEMLKLEDDKRLNV